MAINLELILQKALIYQGFLIDEAISDRLSELRIQKQLNVAEKELKRKEEGLFLDQARIDVAAEDEIDLIRGIDGIEFDLYQIFEADVS